jgi:DNA-binding NtrC family response regulator
MYWTQNSHDEAPTTTQSRPALIRRKGLLLIDDDEFFRTLFLAIARASDVPAEAFASLADMPSFAALKDYDCVIVDYFLESFRGPEIAEYVDVFFNDLPVLVISGGEINDQDKRAWPTCIRRFVAKEAGPYAIIEQALKALAACPASSKVANLN